jgi:hypothetical protein
MTFCLSTVFFFLTIFVSLEVSQNWICHKGVKSLGNAYCASPIKKPNKSGTKKVSAFVG